MSPFLHRRKLPPIIAFIAAAAALAHAQQQDPLAAPSTVQAQQRAELTPDEKFQRISGAMNRLIAGGRASDIAWSEDSQSVTFACGRDRFIFNLAARTVAAAPEVTDEAPTTRREARTAGSRNRGGGMPARGRQREREASPDGRWVAVCKEWNVVIQPADSDAGPDLAASIAVTTDGHRKVRYGTASWVYGEELDQRDAMWWSPDSAKLAFYEFDERQVPDHYITAGLTDLHTRVLVEGYPKPGEPNPIANLQVYDLASKAITRIVGPEVGEWYTYNVQWAPDGKHLLFLRTNRHQNILHLVAADPATGATRIVLTEKQDTWQGNRPTMRFLDDGQGFIWETEQSGYKNYQLRNLAGELVATLTSHDFPVAGITRIDEEYATLYYTAFSDPSCPLNAQLHSVKLDGSGGRRHTSDPLNHTAIDISPDARWFIATAEAADTPPSTVLYSMAGEKTATLCESDRSDFDAWGLEMPELFTFKADDGVTDLYGVLFKPSDFDPANKYPLLIDVYGGPESQAVRNRFVTANPACEYGFVIAKIDNRGTINRGKAFESATYLRLGDKDIKDQADAVRFLAQRDYIDASRVGIYGHSYGGYLAALGILKFPDVFHAAVAGAPVTDWKNYDTIYTERYMRTPQENPEGYAVGSCLQYAHQLRGHLLILHGMVDDNVHPNNIWQLADLLQKEDKPFEMMLYPNADHGVGGNSSALRWRFLRKHLLNSQ